MRSRMCTSDSGVYAAGPGAAPFDGGALATLGRCSGLKWFDPQRPFVAFVDVAAAPTSVCAATFDAAAAAVTTCAAFVIAVAVDCELPSTLATVDVVNGTLTRADTASPVPTFNRGDEATTALLFINSTT